MNYIGNYRTPTASIKMAKLLINRIISTKRAAFMTMVMKNFYLQTPLADYKYVKMKFEDFPQEIIDEYKLYSINKHG